MYNACQGELEAITLREMVNLGRTFVQEYPLKNPLWYPSGFMTSNKTFYWLSFLVLHIIPAIIIDFILKAIGEKPVLVSRSTIKSVFVNIFYLF